MSKEVVTRAVMQNVSYVPHLPSDPDHRAHRLRHLRARRRHETRTDDARRSGGWRYRGGCPADQTGRFAAVDVVDRSDLLAGLEGQISVWEHRTDEVRSPPPGFRLLARSSSCAVEALAADDRRWWGTQFHPEEWSVDHPAGRVVLENFLGLAGIPLR